MRAHRGFACSAVSVALLAGGARALPQPAYAANQGGSLAPSQTLDRYGGGGTDVSVAAASSVSGPGSAHLLSWAGKASPVPVAAAPAPYAVSHAASATAPPSSAWRPPPAPTGAPATIYDAPPKPAQAAAPGAMAANTLPPPPTASTRRQVEGGPRFYSVHRDYGIEPDAIPLAPQFFGPTADLSAPPSDALVKRVTSASGQTRTVDVASGDQTSP